MYEDNHESIDWLKIILRVVICILIFLLVLKLIAVIITNKNEKNRDNVMNSNLDIIQEKIEKSLSNDLVPKGIGDTNKYSLKELQDKKIVGVINDEKGKECDPDLSYVEITKLETEVQVKVNLVCNDKEDYSNNFIISKDKTTANKTTTKKIKTTATTTKVISTTKKNKTTTTIAKKKTTNKTTTKKVTTTTSVKKYEISFNVNGGEYIKPIYVKKGETIKNIIPTRSGYTFVGWYHNGTKFDISTKINNDLVLVAKWSKN